jgi:hypothetical protein
MLARDPVEAAEQARAFLREKPLAAFYDDVLLEGLRLAQADAERGLLDEERTQGIRDAVAEIVDDLSGHEDKDEVVLQDEAPKLGESPLAQLDKIASRPKLGLLRERWRTEKPVLCIHGLGLLDEAAAMMIAQLLERQGIGARVEQADALSMSRISGWDTKGTAVFAFATWGMPPPRRSATPPGVPAEETQTSPFLWRRWEIRKKSRARLCQRTQNLANTLYGRPSKKLSQRQPTPRARLNCKSKNARPPDFTASARRGCTHQIVHFKLILACPLPCERCTIICFIPYASRLAPAASPLSAQTA